MLNQSPGTGPGVKQVDSKYMETISLQGKHKDKHVLVSNEDFERLSNMKWYYVGGTHKYAATKPWRKGRQETIYMHRLVAGTPAGLQTDHINGDTFDNRRENLRVCSVSQNQANKKKQVQKAAASSKYKGVSWNSFSGKWQAYLFDGDKQKFLGRFPTQNVAALIYNMHAKALFGDFARLNVVK